MRVSIPVEKSAMSCVCRLAVLSAIIASAGTTPNAPVTPPPTPPTENPGKDPESTTGDPVGYVSGSVYDAVVDVRAACPDVDLLFKRAYGSWSTRSGTLGYGWAHAYEWSVEEREDGSLLVFADADPEVAGCAKVHRFKSVGATGASFDAAGYSLERKPEGGYLFTSPAGTRHEFDGAGRLVSSTTWNGTRIAFERDAPEGRVARAVHANGRSLGFRYADDGLLVRVTTPDPSVWIELDYTNVASMSSSEGTSVSAVSRDEWRYLSRVVRHDGARAATNLYEYSVIPEAGRRVPYVVCSSRPAQTPGGSPIRGYASANLAYSNVVDRARSVLAAKIDASGLGTVYGYVRDSDGPEVRCAYSTMDGGLFETSLDFGLGETVERRPYAGGVAETALGYDELLRETRRRTADETRDLVYDTDGNLMRETVSSSTTGAFLVSDCGYDAAHRVTSVRRTLGAGTGPAQTQSWDERRRIPRRVVTPGGRVREWTEDGHDVTVYGAGAGDARLVTHVRCTTNDVPREIGLPDGGRVDLAYDAAGYLAGVAASALPSASFTRDALGHVASVARPGPSGARVTSYARNARGRPLSVVHPDGTSESFAYDGNGTKVVRHVDALGREDLYRWVLGLPVHAGRVVDGATNVLWTVSHDRQLNVVAITDPLGRPAETYVLDANERVVAVTNLEGQVLARSYLVSDLVSSETRFDGTAVDYTYDARVNLASVAYPDDTLRFGYDRDGLVTSASNAAGTVTNVHDAATGWLDVSRGADGTEVSYRHSDGGAVTSVTTVAGTTVYALDLAGRRTRIDSPCGTLSVGHCPWNGLVSAVTNANGIVAAYDYDIMNRVTNITWRTASGARLGGFAYRYDALGRIVSRTHDLGGASFDRAYAYDAMDRLVSDGGAAYVYDAAGNRTTRTGDGGTVAYALGTGDRLAAWTGGAYEHDAAGCVTRITRGADTWDLAWNGQYQLVSVSTNGVFAESYQYDALGRRVSTTNAGGTTRHVYDDSWQVVADLDEDGNVVRSYVWGEGIDKLLAVKVGMRVYAALTDVQGTVWGYADESGNVVARWTYDAWGNVLSEEVDDSATELRAVRYRFQGREWSAATGLTNFRARWYDPGTGRWLSKDPIRLSGGLNLYDSFSNKPNILVDPFGLWTFQIGVSGTGGAGNGGTVGVGFAFGRSSSGQWQLGVYYTGGDGAYISKGGGVSVDFTWSPNDDICDLEGVGQTVGGSGTTPIGSVGGEASFPLPTGDGPLPCPSVSGSWGVSTPLPEVHAFTTITGIADIWRW